MFFYLTKFFPFPRIYESRDYLWNQVVVFHSLFLSTCERRRSVRSVHIGHYVLPPASIQDGENATGCTSHQITASNCCGLLSLILRGQTGGREVNLGVFWWAAWNRGKSCPLNLEFIHFTTLSCPHTSLCLVLLLEELEHADGWRTCRRIQQKWVCYRSS